MAFGEFEPKGENLLTAIYSVDEAHLFFRDLIFGRPFPLTLVTRSLDNLGVLLAVTLFLHRDLAIRPEIPGLFAASNLMDSCGTAGLAHVDRDLSKFLRLIRKLYISAPTKSDQQRALETAVGWLRTYILEGSFPALPPDSEPPRIVDRGTDGFVFATSFNMDLLLGWEELYRQGALRGVLMHQAAVNTDRWHVLAARKSPFLSFDLTKGAALLNEAEAAMDEPREWVTDGLWLRGPLGGTLILPSLLLQVFLRI